MNAPTWMTAFRLILVHPPQRTPTPPLDTKTCDYCTGEHIERGGRRSRERPNYADSFSLCS